MSKEGLHSLHCWHPLPPRRYQVSNHPHNKLYNTEQGPADLLGLHTVTLRLFWCVSCRRFFQLPSVTILGAMAFYHRWSFFSWRFGMASCGCLSSEVKRKNDGTMGNAETPCADQQARFLSAIVDNGVFEKLKNSQREALTCTPCARSLHCLLITPEYLCGLLVWPFDP